MNSDDMMAWIKSDTERAMLFGYMKRDAEIVDLFMSSDSACAGWALKLIEEDKRNNDDKMA